MSPNVYLFVVYICRPFFDKLYFRAWECLCHLLKTKYYKKIHWIFLSLLALSVIRCEGELSLALH